MKNNIFIAAFLAMIAMTATAQETYENAFLARPELNGTARYVGMGGAMEALGADLSVISSNPAGIGLFRHSHANVSFGFVSQSDAESFYDAKKTNASFDQGGFVISTKMGKKSYINFAFSYGKERNFDNILYAAGQLGGASQANMTYNKLNQGYLSESDFLGGGGMNYYYSQLDYLYASQFYSSDEGDFYDFQGDDYEMTRGNTGYIGRYDFNISGNINDRVFLGITFGIYDVHYDGYSEYTETALNNSELTGVLVQDSRRITGTGFDVKAGIIVRPFEDSPFRIGFSVASPVMYDLETSNVTGLTLYDSEGKGSYYSENSEYYKFRMNTPWKFGASLGHTIGNYLALGASYEYADYGNIDTRIKDGYDDWGWGNSSSDRVMNDHTESTLKGVSTIKVGAEVKPDQAVAIRVGFNYVTSMFEEDGFKDGTLYSPGTYYQSATDYTNWEETYRVTAGLGFKVDHINLDVAYQYSTTNGQFCPFMDAASYEDGAITNYGDVVKVNDKRHQMIISLGYTF